MVQRMLSQGASRVQAARNAAGGGGSGRGAGARQRGRRSSERCRRRALHLRLHPQPRHAGPVRGAVALGSLLTWKLWDDAGGCLCRKLCCHGLNSKSRDAVVPDMH